MRVIVSIDELVLHGVSPAERHRIGDALETELAARLSEPGTGRRLALAGDRARVIGTLDGGGCCDDAAELAGGLAAALGGEDGTRARGGGRATPRATPRGVGR